LSCGDAFGANGIPVRLAWCPWEVAVSNLCLVFIIINFGHPSIVGRLYYRQPDSIFTGFKKIGFICISIKIQVFILFFYDKVLV
jgi:hypothetical protein